MYDACCGQMYNRLFPLGCLWGIYMKLSPLLDMIADKVRQHF